MFNREKCLDDVVRHDILNVLTAVLLLLDIFVQDYLDGEATEDVVRLQAIAEDIKNILRGKDGQKGSWRDILAELQILQGSSQVLMATMPGNDVTEKIFRHSERIKCIVDTAKACRKSLNLKSFILSEVVERESRYLGIAISMGRENLSFQADCMFSRVVGNIFQNAIRHGGATEVAVSVKRVGKDAIVVFEDNGKGVPEKNKQRIFEYGFTTKVGEPGGEGLAYCMDILALSEASISETGVEGRGARFEVFIPAEDIV